jgi:glycerophosphoryl diester phosphodiesterase
MRLPLPVANVEANSDPGSRTVNVAHRGASDEAPENTLAAIRRAIALGADMVEIDVQRTRDGVLVLLHDTTLVRTTNAREVFPTRGPWRVADFAFDELRRLDAGSWKGRGFAGERIPSLTEALEVIDERSAGLLLELKAPDLYPGVVSDVVSTMGALPGYVESAVARRRLVVQSFSFAAMKELKTQVPEIPVGLLGAPSRANQPALATWADQVNPSHLSVDRAYVDEVHRLGMNCLVWTVSHSYLMRRALRAGVDGVITNRPAALRGLLLSREADRGHRPSFGDA